MHKISANYARGFQGLFMQILCITFKCVNEPFSLLSTTF